jgi:hypothetical protein
MATYEDVHSGDVVLGHDGEVWGVERIAHVPHLAVTLIRDGGVHRITGYPPPGTEVTVLQRADVSAEARAAQMFIDAGIGVEVVSEGWETGDVRARG